MTEPGVDHNSSGGSEREGDKPAEGGYQGSGFFFGELTSPDSEMLEKLRSLATRFNGSRSQALDQSYTAGEILQVRNALKLSSKLIREYLLTDPDVSPVSSQELGSMGAMQSSYNAIVSVMAGHSVNETVAFTLLPALNQAIGLGSKELFLDGVSRKFGEDVKQMLVEHEDGSSPLEMPSRNKYTSKVASALKYVHEKLQGRVRRWGPSEEIPVAHHAAETALILAMSGAKWPIVECGLLHDFIEDRPDGMSQAEARAELADRFRYFTAHVVNALSEDRNALSFSHNVSESDITGGEQYLYSTFVSHLRRQIPSIADDIETRFNALIHTPQDKKWMARKSLIKTQLLMLNELDPEVALAAAKVCCAAKASTMSAGNKYLWETSGSFPIDEAINGWSTGGYELNRIHWEVLESIFTHIGVSGPLLEQFQLEMDRFDGFGNQSNVH